MSSNNKFWDVEDLLMSNETVSCIANKDITGLTFNDKDTNLDFDSITKEGQKLELPYWMGNKLRKNEFVTIKKPKFLTYKFYYQTVADPTIINFKNKNNFIYDLYLEMIPYMDEEAKWSRNIADCFYKRFYYIFLNSIDIEFENHNLIKNLSLKEKKFYDEMLKINRNFKYYHENYFFNNKTFEEVNEANKKIVMKKKKMNSSN
jgi:hypothetical protein